jgi:DNA modification methylase
MNWTVIGVGNTKNIIERLENNSVQTIVTSPPYYGLRNYGIVDQIGLEPTPQKYVDNLVAIFRQCYRVLKPDGTMWLNIGDSYARDARKGQHKPGDSGKQAYLYDQGGGRASACVSLNENLKPKDMLGIPWTLAFALRDDGWYLRSDICWHKFNALPESVKDRPTNAYEHIFLLTKSEKYYYDYEAVKELAQCNRMRGPALHPDLISTNGNSGLSRRQPTEFRNLRNVWDIPEDEYTQFLRWKTEHANLTNVWRINTRPFRGAHFAVMPPDLIVPCIKAGSAPDQIVFDPFGGAGTTALVANQLGRNAILLEINPDYARLAYERLIANGIDKETIILE